MDEETLLYEDDYEPEAEEPEAEDVAQAAVPTSAAETSAEASVPAEQATASRKDERPGGAPRGGEEPAGPSGRNAAPPPNNSKNKRARGSSGGIRYFIIRSSTLQNIFISVRVGAWATTRQNDDKLDDAFRKSKEVRLLYSVAGSNAFQGYAVMRTPIGKFGRPVLWENGKQFGNPFGVEWRILFELPHSAVEHLRNPFNENRPLHVARDGTEVPQEQGDLVVRLMQERAVAAGAKAPRQQLAMLEGGGRPAPGLGMPGRGPGLQSNPAGRMMPGPPRGPGMGPGVRPLGGPGMDPAAAMMAMGGGLPQGRPGPLGAMGPVNAGLLPGGVSMEQLVSSVAMNNFNPAALNASLQQAGIGLPQGGGAIQQQQLGTLQAFATAMVAQMANLPLEQQAITMAAITASNPMLAEAIAAVVNSGTAALTAGAMPSSGLPQGHMSRPGQAGMGLSNAMPNMNGHGHMGGGGGSGGMERGMGASGVGQMGGAQRNMGPMGLAGHGEMGGHGHMGGLGGPNGSQQQMLTKQQQMQQAEQQFMSINRDEVVLEGSDGRLRSGRSRSRSRSRSPVHGRRSGGGALDFNSMTYEQYLQQYGRVQQEVQRRVGGSNGHQRHRSPERSPRRMREPTATTAQGMMGQQGNMASGGTAAAMAGGGAGAGSGMASKPGGQPYTEEEYIRVTQVWYASRGQAPPSESFIRQHYRQMLTQLQQQR